MKFIFKKSTINSFIYDAFFALVWFGYFIEKHPLVLYLELNFKVKKAITAEQ